MLRYVSGGKKAQQMPRFVVTEAVASLIDLKVFINVSDLVKTGSLPGRLISHVKPCQTITPRNGTVHMNM